VKGESGFELKRSEGSEMRRVNDDYYDLIAFFSFPFFSLFLYAYLAASSFMFLAFLIICDLLGVADCRLQKCKRSRKLLELCR